MEEVKKNNGYDYMAKIIIIGDSGVGKTNFITRLCENHFKQTYVATIGVDFKIKTVDVGGRRYKLQIWDTAGQERFKNITQAYYKGAAGIVLAFSIIDRHSFENIQRWMSQIDDNAAQDVCKIIIGTKGDLDVDRQVTTECGIALAQKHGLRYVEVSAKSGKNITQAVNSLVQQIHENFEKNSQMAAGLTSKEVLISGRQQQGSRKNCAC